MSYWKTGGELYLPSLAAAEAKYALPADLLARVAFEECSWRPEIIDYTVKSSTGAMGILQLEPRFFPGVGGGWKTDIPIGAAELERLHAHYADWQLAIAAYNWGEGDVDRWDAQGGGFSKLPTQTQNYVTQVFGDVPVVGSVINV
jgi:soluble lytic murein transglycosylase-like protein